MLRVSSYWSATEVTARLLGVSVYRSRTMLSSSKTEPDTQVRVEAAIAAVPTGVLVRGNEIPHPEPLAGRDWSVYADPVVSGDGTSYGGGRLPRRTMAPPT